jgi:hypothetical protein
VRTHQGLFAGIFGRGGVDTGDEAWLQAMLDTEAALARALERAGLAEPGAGAAVTAAAQADAFDAAELGRQAALTGNPVPALVRELSRMVPLDAAGAVHKGATSQDIIDTAAMLLVRGAVGGGRRPVGRRVRRHRARGGPPGHHHDRPHAAARVEVAETPLVIMEGRLDG